MRYPYMEICVRGLRCRVTSERQQNRMPGDACPYPTPTSHAPEDKKNGISARESPCVPSQSRIGNTGSHDFSNGFTGIFQFRHFALIRFVAIPRASQSLPA